MFGNRRGCVRTACTLLLFTSARAVAAQTVPAGRFLDADGMYDYACERADQRRLSDVLARITALLRALPVLDPPRGADVRPALAIGLSPEKSCVHPTTADLALQIFQPSLKDARGGEAGGSITFTINPVPIALANVNNAPFEDEHGPAYYARTQTGTVAGYPVFGELGYGDPAAKGFKGPGLGGGAFARLHVLLTGPSEPMFLPLTRERYLLRQIKKQKAVADTLGRIAAASPYQKWLSESEERRKTREEALRGMAAAGMPAAEVTRMREQFERTEKELAETLKAEEANRKPEMAESVQRQHSAAARLEAELAALSPAERKSAAWVGPRGNDEFGLVAAGAPNARALVIPNPAFYDAKRQRRDVQALLVQFYTHNSPHILALERAVFRELDWTALAALLK